MSTHPAMWAQAQHVHIPSSGKKTTYTPYCLATLIAYTLRALLAQWLAAKAGLFHSQRLVSLQSSKDATVGYVTGTCLQVMVNVKVVLGQELLPSLRSCGGQLDVADGDLSPCPDWLQGCEDDALLAEALHCIGGAGVVDQGSCGEQAHTCTQKK